MCIEVESSVNARREYSPDEEVNAYTYQCIDDIQDVVTLFQELINQPSPAIRQQVALVSLSLTFKESSRIRRTRAVSIEQSMHYFLTAIRSLVRKTDTVYRHGTTCYFLLPTANIQGGYIVQERLWEALLTQVQIACKTTALRPVMMTIGHSAYPDSGQDAQQCLTIAQTARRTLDFRPKKSAPALSMPAGEDSELPQLARQLGVPYLSLLPRKLPLRVRHLLSPTLAQELHCFPVGRERDVLTVAIADPRDCSALDRLRQETGLHIFPILVPPNELQTALEQLG